MVFEVDRRLVQGAAQSLPLAPSYSRGFDRLIALCKVSLLDARSNTRALFQISPSRAF